MTSSLRIRNKSMISCLVLATTMITVDALTVVKGRYSQNRQYEATSSALPGGITECANNADNFGDMNAPLLMPNSIAGLFCAHGGTCLPNSTTSSSIQVCQCPDGYEGPHCEFVKGSVPSTCILPCVNGGTCVNGAISWAQLFTVNTSSTGTNNPVMAQTTAQEYCFCPSGFTGPYCETPVAACGPSQVCYNGGTCVEITSPTTGNVSYHCDCTSAAALMGRLDFAGDSCQFPATSFCSLDQNGRQFCVNGGTCRSSSHMGCQCPSEFTGPICEFEDMNLTEVRCDLQCENHGICRKGSKDLSVVKAFIKKDQQRRRLDPSFRELARLSSTSYNSAFEHCVCPAGFAGLQCEYELNICPGGQHACMNGGECKSYLDGNRQLQFTCDCTKAQNATARFLGDYCEMPSTQFCTLDGRKTSRGGGQDAFCTNGGTCLRFVQQTDGHPGCNCPTGFSGKHCEFSGQAASSLRSSNNNNDESRMIQIVSWTLVAVIAALTLGVAWMWRSDRHRRFRRLAAPNTRSSRIDRMSAGSHDAMSVATTPTKASSSMISSDRFKNQTPWRMPDPPQRSMLSSAFMQESTEEEEEEESQVNSEFFHGASMADTEYMVDTAGDLSLDKYSQDHADDDAVDTATSMLASSPALLYKSDIDDEIHFMMQSQQDRGSNGSVGDDPHVFDDDEEDEGNQRRIVHV